MKSTDLIGFAIAAVVLLVEYWGTRKIVVPNRFYLVFTCNRASDCCADSGSNSSAEVLYSGIAHETILQRLYYQKYGC